MSNYIHFVYGATRGAGTILYVGDQPIKINVVVKVGDQYIGGPGPC